MTTPAPFFHRQTALDPRSQEISPWGTNEDAGVDFVSILHEARRKHVCPQCRCERDYRERPRSPFCSRECGYRFRDRRRYVENPERERERARAYYWRSRERVLEKAAAKRGSERSPERTTCSECGRPLEGRQRLTCGSAG